MEKKQKKQKNSDDPGPRLRGDAESTGKLLALRMIIS